MVISQAMAHAHWRDAWGKDSLASAAKRRVATEVAPRRQETDDAPAGLDVEKGRDLGRLVTNVPAPVSP
jgi:hypothetical protein